MTISVQIEYNGKKEEVLLKNPTRVDRHQFVNKFKEMRKNGEENQEDAFIAFDNYRADLVLKLLVKSPFPATESGLNELSAIDFDKIANAVQSEVNLTMGFQTPSNGQPPTAPEES